MDEKYFYRIGMEDGIQKAKNAYTKSFIIGFFLFSINNIFLSEISFFAKYIVAINIAIVFIFTFVVPTVMLASATNERS